MSTILGAFSWSRPTTITTAELPVLWCLPVLLEIFVRIDVVTIFSKILAEALERTHGLSEDQMQLTWDSCVKSEAPDGLVTLLAKAMANQSELFLVYEKTVGVIREAIGNEIEEIRKGYRTRAQAVNLPAGVGVYVSFENFDRAKMVRLYCTLDYANIDSLYTSMNVSKAVQIKAHNLRESVGLKERDLVLDQAKGIVAAMKAGRGALMDAKDFIEQAKPDLTATNASVSLVAAKMAFYLNMPAAWLTGIQTGGLGTNGVGDTKAIDRGLRSYFFPILKPVLDSLFGVKTTFKPDDMTQIIGALEVAKTFSIMDDELVSMENRQKILNRAFGLPEDAKGDAPAKTVALPPPVVPDPKRVE